MVEPADWWFELHPKAFIIDLKMVAHLLTDAASTLSILNQAHVIGLRLAERLETKPDNAARSTLLLVYRPELT
jgi:hypothetical protein